MKMQITVQVDEELYKKITEKAEREDRPIANVVRLILKEYFDR